MRTKRTFASVKGKVLRESGEAFLRYPGLFSDVSGGLGAALAVFRATLERDVHLRSGLL